MNLNTRRLRVAADQLIHQFGGPDTFQRLFSAAVDSYPAQGDQFLLRGDALAYWAESAFLDLCYFVQGAVTGANIDDSLVVSPNHIAHGLLHPHFDQSHGLAIFHDLVNQTAVDTVVLEDTLYGGGHFPLCAEICHPGPLETLNEHERFGAGVIAGQETSKSVASELSERRRNSPATVAATDLL